MEDHVVVAAEEHRAALLKKPHVRPQPGAADEGAAQMLKALGLLGVQAVGIGRIDRGERAVEERVHRSIGQGHRALLPVDAVEQVAILHAPLWGDGG